MEERCYVATDETGVELFDAREVHWQLPERRGDGFIAGHPLEGERPPFVIRSVRSLLDALDEVVCVAEVDDATATASKESPGAYLADAVSLTERTSFDVRGAALFALDCAEHGLGDAADVELPRGIRVGDAIAEARRFLTGAGGVDEGRLGLLARLSMTRRLRRHSTALGDVALGLLEEDLANELDATDDPAWTTTAAAVDAVLAAIEGLRHLAMPRYVAGREDVSHERDDNAGQISTPTLLETAWGPIAVGAEHESPYMSAAHLAREAALRARESAYLLGGESAEADEAAWQVSRLAVLLDG